MQTCLGFLLFLPSSPIFQTELTYLAVDTCPICGCPVSLEYSSSLWGFSLSYSSCPLKAEARIQLPSLSGNESTGNDLDVGSWGAQGSEDRKLRM